MGVVVGGDMNQDITISPVRTGAQLRAFARFPWQIYRDDPNWVPPLLADKLAYLTPSKNPLLLDAEYVLLTARRDGHILGTIGVLAEPPDGDTAEHAGAFGFLEVVEQYAVAHALLNAARAWAKGKGLTVLRGPMSFGDWENPGVLIEGADCPPAMLEGHTPPYYREFLESYGLTKDHDLYAWRAYRSQVGESVGRLPAPISRAAQAAEKQGVRIRSLRLGHWAAEVETARNLFNATLTHLPEFRPASEREFHQLADRMRLILDPDLALFAELDGRVVGFCVSLPDVNRALIHLRRQVWPIVWLQLWWHARHIDVLTFKLMGVLSEYRHRGIDALLFVNSLSAMLRKGYAWLDGSLTSENNAMVNLLASHFGAERYKHYRIYRMVV